ncbi:MAG: histidine phosphatase family protein [Chloroflexota bacterium]
MDLIIIRHALPTQGIDPPLSAEGHRQAAVVTQRLAQESSEANGPIHHIVSSPLQRARQTAEPLSQLLGLEIEIVDGLAEADKEGHEYVPVEQMRRERPEEWKIFIQDPISFLGSDADRFQSDVLSGFAQVIERYPGKTVAIFSHVLTINVFLRDILQSPISVPFTPDYCSISRVRASRSGQRSVISVNDTGHFAKS